MKEIVMNTAISFTRKQVIKNGAEECMQAATRSLAQHTMDQFAEMICDNLQINNEYQFILTIKKIE